MLSDEEKNYYLSEVQVVIMERRWTQINADDFVLH
jgi:hypothetical protein